MLVIGLVKEDILAIISVCCIVFEDSFTIRSGRGAVRQRQVDRKRGILLVSKSERLKKQTNTMRHLRVDPMFGTQSFPELDTNCIMKQRIKIAERKKGAGVVRRGGRGGIQTFVHGLEIVESKKNTIKKKEVKTKQTSTYSGYRIVPLGV